MSVKPKHPWTAKVHAYLLASKTQATSQQIVAMFGRPEGSLLARERMAGGVKGKWFDVAGQCENAIRENLYIALEKKSLRSSVPTLKKATKIPKPGVRPVQRPTCYASIWDVAGSVPAQIPPRPGPAISTRLSPLAQWVSA